MSWLDDVLLQHRELETPLAFWYWAGLATLSAILKDNVWIDRQLYNLYPNIYVMLHADSGLKKGPPIAMAAKIVQLVNNTRIIRGRSSIQGILKQLATAETVPGGRLNHTKSNAFICSSELSSSIVEDRSAMNILTDLYDRHYNVGEWRSLLKSEVFDLVDPTITMLTATNEAHAEQFFERQDIQGGYFARTFVIYADTENTVNALVDPLEHPPDYSYLAEHVRAVAQLRGAFRPLHGTAAGECYRDWYHRFADERRSVRDETGLLNRFGDHVLKVAMLLSVSRSLALEVDLDSMQEAISQCQLLIGHSRRVTMGKTGKSSVSVQKGAIIKLLASREPPVMSRAQLARVMGYDLQGPELDQVMTDLATEKIIEIESHGAEIVYIMTDEMMQQIRSHFEGRS
jgi:hypothetical protein